MLAEDDSEGKRATNGAFACNLVTAPKVGFLLLFSVADSSCNYRVPIVERGHFSWFGMRRTNANSAVIVVVMDGDCKQYISILSSNCTMHLNILEEERRAMAGHRIQNYTGGLISGLGFLRSVKIFLSFEEKDVLYGWEGAY